MPTMNLSSTVKYTTSLNPTPVVYNINSDVNYSTVLSGSVEIPANSPAGFTIAIPCETALFNSGFFMMDRFQAQCLGLVLVNRNASDIILSIGSGEGPPINGGGTMPAENAGPIIIEPPRPGPGPGPNVRGTLQLAANGMVMITNPTSVSSFIQSMGFPAITGLTVSAQRTTPGYVDFWFFNDKASVVSGKEVLVDSK